MNTKDIILNFGIPLYMIAIQFGTRSLLHADHPLLANRSDIPLTFGREVNKYGVAFYFVGATALRVLIDKEGKGDVYSSEGEGVTSPLLGREDLGERRAPQALRWLLVAQTEVSDLPDFLQVIDASELQTWNFLDTLPKHEDPVLLADSLGVSMVSMIEWRVAN